MNTPATKPVSERSGRLPSRRSDGRTVHRSGGWLRSIPKLALACCLLARAASAQEYHANDLTPAGSSSGKLTSGSSGRQAGSATQANGYYHAVLLSGNALAVTDLNPLNYYYSQALCSDDSQQGGWGYGPLGTHALVWSGSASSGVDLHPGGYMFSYCLGVHNGEQVGYAQNQSYFVTASHAYSWHGSGASGVDLHPLGTTYPYSRAMGCHDGEEVGYVSSLAYPDGDSSGYHTTSSAMKWHGSSASAVSLHPPGCSASEATCTSGTQQGGWGLLLTGTTYSQHALLWSGSADTAVDLHPAGYTDSKVTSLSGAQQVGEGWVGAQGAYGSVRHALTWNGTPDGVVDLNHYLPAGYSNAVATGIDANGNVVGYAYNTAGGYHPSGLAIPSGAICVVFAPGAPAPTQLASLTLSPANVAPGDNVQVTVALGGAAPVGGVNISFLSTVTTLAATPASLVIPEGASNAVFSITTGGTTLTAPSSLKIYATDGAVSRAAGLALTPVVKASSLTLNTVEGGFSTYGTLSLNIPAQFGGANVALTSGDTSLVAVPASVTVPQGYSAWSFSANTAPVTATTAVPVTASLNGTTATGTVTLSPAPVISLTSLTGQEIVGGQPMTVSVSLNNFPRAIAGAVITLTSGDVGALQVPATITVAQGAYSASVTAMSSVVAGRKGVSIKATYNGGSLTTTVFVNPIPTVTILQADYLTDTHMFKVQASTTFTNAILTYGGSPDAAPFGTMQWEQGVFKGSMILATAPTQATVWNSLGGFATVPVNLKTSTATGGGGGGGGSTSTSYKLTVVTAGKGSVATSPVGTSFAPGTVVTLTATPAAGSPWIGWSGAVTSTSRTISVTMNQAVSVTANFK